MSARNRSQNVYLIVEKGNISFLPVGCYKLYVDGTSIEKGSIKLTARILDTILSYGKKFTTGVEKVSLDEKENLTNQEQEKIMASKADEKLAVAVLQKFIENHPSETLDASLELAYASWSLKDHREWSGVYRVFINSNKIESGILTDYHTSPRIAVNEAIEMFNEKINELNPTT